MRKANPELHDRRRTEILDAAERCFLQTGFHRAGMQDIASSANLSMGLLYRYFSSKTAIIEAFVERERRAHLSRIADLARARSFPAALRRLVKLLVTEQSAPDVLRIENEIMAEACRNEGLRSTLIAHDAAIRDALAKVIESQQAAGAVDHRLDSRMAACLVMALVEGAGLRVFLHTDLEPEALVRHAADAAMRILRSENQARAGKAAPGP